MYWGSGWGAGGWILMALMMAAFWVAVAAGIVWLVRSSSDQRGRPAQPPRSDAIAILEERFARGEIDRAEFEERMAVLKGRPAG